MKYVLITLLFIVGLGVESRAQKNDLTRYVNTLQGTNSKYELTRGNTYPTTALPWGMNFGLLKQDRMGVVGFTNILKTLLGDLDKLISVVPGLMIILLFH